ncbi:MAG: spondin domain-containing protein [Gammaproteobacteria bacterium]|nr:spondin domain-containing protein [Gammaproteobacteria bacterium]
MKTTLIASLALSGALLSTAVHAREVSVEVTNLTNGIYYTPLLVAAHRPDVHLFEVGTPASTQLQAMAEGGDISGLISDVEAAGGTYAADPAGGLLAPGASATAMLDVHARRTSRLSIVAMLLPTNDGFIGIDSLPIPKRRGTYIYYARGYDAGTEANDEIVNGGGAPGVPGIPADPGGNNGTSGTGAAGPDHNSKVHVHRGVLGDADPAGGPSDLDSSVHRWHNPVARVVLRVGLGRDDD